MTPTTRDQVLEVIKRLPAETSVEEAMERLYFLAEIETGLRQVEAGQVVSHEEAKRRLAGPQITAISGQKGRSKISKLSGPTSLAVLPGTPPYTSSACSPPRIICSRSLKLDALSRSLTEPTFAKCSLDPTGLSTS